MQDIWIPTDHGALHAMVAPAASPKSWLVLWPSLGGTAEQFLHLLTEGRSWGINLLAVDPPGHGRTPALPVPWAWPTVDGVWRILLDYAEAHGATTIAVGGHSFGAYAALLGTLHEPRASAYVLLDGGYLDPYPVYDRPLIKEAVSRYLASRRFPSWKAFWDAERQESNHWDDVAQAALTATMYEAHGVIQPIVSVETAMAVSDLLSQYHVRDLPLDDRPALLLMAGEPASLLPSREKAAMAFGGHRPHTTVRIVPGSGHDMLLDNPAFVLEAIRRFLAPEHG